MLNARRIASQQALSPVITYSWPQGASKGLAILTLARVDGTSGSSYPFGNCLSGSGGPQLALNGSCLGVVPVFQGFWTHVIGPDSNPAVNQAHDDHPVENISWDNLHAPGGFLDRLNASPIRAHLAAQAPQLNAGARFRLPTETE